MKIRVISGSREELGKIFDKATKLRYKAYLEMGFTSQNKDQTIQDSYDDSARHFIALEENEVVGTISLITGKLPLESIFSEEKRDLMRKSKVKKAVELSRFAIEKDYRVNKSKKFSKTVSFALYKKVYLHLLLKRIKLVLVVVHPMYVEKYTSQFNFEKYGEVKDYEGAQGNPAVLLYQTRSAFWKSIRKLLKKTIENKIKQ